MTTVTLGSIGERVQLLIKQGSTFGPHSVLIKNPDGSAVDMTGAQVRGQIRKKALDVAVVASFTINITNSSTESFNFGLDDAVTAAITAGESQSETASLYVWDLEWEDSAGTVRPLFYGPVQVFREVTRP